MFHVGHPIMWVQHAWIQSVSKKVALLTGALGPDRLIYPEDRLRLVIVGVVTHCLRKKPKATIMLTAPMLMPRSKRKISAEVMMIYCPPFGERAR